FLVIVISIVLFTSIFGGKNALVGVSGITAALSLLGTDYTLKPVKNTIYFVVLEVTLGIATFLASTNALLGLIITFCAIFYILYSFTYNTKKPTYVAFTLGYCFMLFTPVTLQELPIRLESLAFCGLLIMILQLFVNKDRLQKQAYGQVISSLKLINEEISLISSNKDTNRISKFNTTVSNNLRNLIETFYEIIDKDIELSVPLYQYLFISQFLYSLNITLNKVSTSTNLIKTESIKDLSYLLNQIEKFINNKEDIHTLIYDFETFLNTHDFIKTKSYLDFELDSYISILMKDLTNTESNNASELANQYFTKNIISKLNSFKNNINRDSLKFTFAFRGALITSLGFFIVSAFNIPQGKWLVFSLISIVQPYLDTSKTKGHDRLIGTIIGLLIFEIVFNIISDNSLRTIIVLLFGYINNFQTKYKNQMVCTTISALGSASIGTSVVLLGFERLLFVFIGTIIALYANKLILPYKISTATKTDIKTSTKLNENILSLLYKKCLNPTSYDEDLISTVTVNKLLNKKIDSNNGMLLSEQINDFVYYQHVLMNEVRILFNMFNEYKLESSFKLQLVYDIDYLMNKDLTKEEILKFLGDIDSTLSKLIVINILELREILLKSKSISNSVINSI
ncbi:MAG: FUSC family protein, partial [Peptostreptococcaceae bacterium]